ncbi:MAG: Holliday junction resolvase RuvX [Acidobacteriota bacterium]
MSRILCLDMGSKNIGMAISDEMKSIAQGLPTVRRDRNLQWLEKIKTISKENSVEKILLGYPVDLNGGVGKSAKEVEIIGAQISEETGMEVVLWDERLSTVQAERVLLQADLGRKKRKMIVDKVASVIILQNYLDSLKNQSLK